MRIHQATVTRMGQITIPKEVREALGLREGDRVNVIQREGWVEIERAGGVVARTAGIVRGQAAMMTAEVLRESAEQAIAEEVVERTVS
ncbi:MAG: AbrB/MazE/SpoVT family DNA-binding domain-containing protein [Thermomicrobiales bacterium]